MRCLLLGAAALITVSAAAPLQIAAQEHDMAAMDSAGTRGLSWLWGAHGAALLTRVSPAVVNRAITEAYITQPAIMAGVTTRGGRLAMMTTISLEGLTLDRGELGPGTYGEGYVDRRHPHTYLHEFMGVGRTTLPVGINASLSIGRGFAPFGTDDPMMRPLIRFPVNHHLSQVLERLVAIGGVSRDAVAVELGLFSGNEPMSTKDLGDPDRFADSWAARVTVRPTAAWEIQGSRAIVKSPEEPTGHGDDQRKLSVSARHHAILRGHEVYALAEWSRTTVVNQGRDADLYATGSMLAEASVARSDWTAALRLERTERPEEGREGDFRTPWPQYDHVILGFTLWNVASAHAQRDFKWRRLVLAPYVETSFAHVESKIPDGAGPEFEPLFDPKQFYGSNYLWSLSAGVRIDLGVRHARMGRYGVALQKR